MRVNLSNVPDDGTYNVLPQGTYRLRLDSWSEKTAGTGKNYVNCEFIVCGGEHDGRKLWDKFFFTDGALWRLKQFSRAVNFAGTDSVDGFEIEDLFRTAIKVDVVADVIVDEYEDTKSGAKKESNKVDRYSNADGTFTDDVPF